jgi:hypothetical protein
MLLFFDVSLYLLMTRHCSVSPRRIVDESKWIGYTFHYVVPVEQPPFKRIKEEK